MNIEYKCRNYRLGVGVTSSERSGRSFAAPQISIDASVASVSSELGGMSH